MLVPGTLHRRHERLRQLVPAAATLLYNETAAAYIRTRVCLSDLVQGCCFGWVAG